MRLTRSGKPGVKPILDILEDFGTFEITPGSIATQKPLIIAGIVDPATANMLFQHLGGAVPSYGTQANKLARILQPGTNQVAVAQSVIGFPIGRVTSDVPVSIRWGRRYVWDTVVQRVTPLIAGVKMFVGFMDDAVQFSGDNGGIGLHSVSTENGGNWTLKWYPTNGGALQTGADSGITPDNTLQHIRFEYFDINPTPSLNIYINGVRKYTITSPNLPAFDGNEPHQASLASGDSVANTIGQIDRNYYNRFFIEQF